MSAPRTDFATKYLAGAETTMRLLSASIAVLVLIPVFRATARGSLFSRRNSRRLAAATAISFAGWVLGAVLPLVAARGAIAGQVSGVPAAWLAPDFRPALWPLVVIGLLAALAEATRRGARLAAETEGLV